MSDTAIEWKDATTHRKPNWPLLGYAPGGYTGRCISCQGKFHDLDKRAYRCFPCAVDSANRAMHEYQTQIDALTAERDTLKAAIQIVDPTAIRQQESVDEADRIR